jgi:hypothetical protein
MALFEPGRYFPPEDSIERLAKYKRMKKLFDGKHIEVYERASKVLKDSPHAKQLENLYIAVNLADILVTKPADLLVGEPPSYESGKPDSSEEQKAINRYVEENDLNQLIHESAIGAGIRGDSWIKVRYGYRQDFSEVDALGLERPVDAVIEPIIEHVNAEFVFPETTRGDVKKFKAINIARVEWVKTPRKEVPFLNVERHVPGYIIYERYRLVPKEPDTRFGVPIDMFYIEEKVSTGRDEDIVSTGLSYIPVFHIPYKSVDSDWEGIGGLEKLETVFAAINDRLVQIDYILWKHADPTAYGPELEGTANTVTFGGKYIPITENDPKPGYMTWDGQLESAFKELDLLLGIVYQMSETPQWLFGTTMTQDKGGTGTSHTDSGAIKARFMPILSKVKRIRTHYDKAIRDALWTCQLFDTKFGDYEFEPVYPTINWKDGIPRDEKELAEIMSIRTGGKPTIDVQSAIKKLDEVDDEKATEIISRIDADEQRVNGFVDGSIFNEAN